MNKTLLLITRCSRLEYLDKIYESISKLYPKFQDINVDIIWSIGFDLNTISCKKQKVDLVKIKQMSLKSKFNITWQFSATNNVLYASNIANDLLYSKANFSADFAYLLDDDNMLHDSIIEICKELELNSISVFGQQRKDKDVIISKHDMNESNCVGLIDSAQFIIPTTILLRNQGYENGYCIDGLTIKKLMQKKYSFRYYTYIASYYNYFTELI